MRTLFFLSFLAFVMNLPFADSARADEDNYNSRAEAAASDTGVRNANCNSALILTCGGSVSTAPAPVIGGGMAMLIAAGIGFVATRRKFRHRDA